MNLKVIEVNESDQTFRATDKCYDNKGRICSQDLDGYYSVSIDEDDNEYIEITQLNVDVLGDGAEDSHFNVSFDEEFEEELSEAITEYLEGK